MSKPEITKDDLTQAVINFIDRLGTARGSDACFQYLHALGVAQAIELGNSARIEFIEWMETYYPVDEPFVVEDPLLHPDDDIDFEDAEFDEIEQPASSLFISIGEINVNFDVHIHLDSEE